MYNALRKFTRAMGCRLGFLLVASGCQKAPEAPPLPSPSVLTTVVHARSESSLERRGAVTAGARLRLGFNAAGVISRIGVKTGDVVSGGQLLAQLKDTDALAALQAAQAVRTRAQRDFRAADVLAESGAAPPMQRDQAQSALQVAEANAALAAEAVMQRRLVSPIAGTVLQRLAEPGEAVAPGIPVLVVEGTRSLVIKVGITERELARVRPGQAATLVDGERSFAASVTSLAPAPGEDGLYAVEVTPQKKLPLVPGALVTVRFDGQPGPPILRVPLDAIVHRDDKSWVFVVDGGQVRLREVTVDRWEGKDGLVHAALRDGDQIVREGGTFLEDGQRVRIAAAP